MSVILKLELPQDLAAILSESHLDLSRAALESLAVEEYRARRLTDAQFRRLPDISRFEADKILKAHAVWFDYSLDVFEHEGKTLRKLQERSIA